jgi:dTDP-4-amino-4,6-dideoxygalactose transaminase
LEEAENITNRRLKSWYFYDQLLKPLESSGQIRCPFVPAHCHHNAHMYYVILSPGFNRDDVIRELKEQGVGSVFHYSPLHLSPAGRHYGKTYGSLPVTESHSERLIRLPLWVGISEDQQEFIVEALTSSLNKRHKLL